MFVLGLLVGAAATYLYVSYDNQLPPFGGNRDIGANRPSEWAQPIANPCLPNLHKVTGNLYRGAQPESGGFKELELMGVRTIVNLRLTDSDKDSIAGTGLNYTRIPAEAWDLDEDEIIRFLKIVNDGANTPVFVHCNHGADRTGAMVAIYRIIVQGWGKQNAIDEMTSGGYGFHSLWGNLTEYIRDMDVESIRRKAGLAGGSSVPVGAVDGR